MTQLNFAPLYRSTVGFDRLFSMLDGLAAPESTGQTYPPYNIERLDEESYRVTMAVAGFTEDELSVETKQSTLTITGEKAAAKDDNGEYLHRGIANRAFERRFQLADHVEVVAAKLENGLLHVDLKREIPEALKPRKIEIGAGAVKQIETKATRTKKAA